MPHAGHVQCTISTSHQAWPAAGFNSTSQHAKSQLRPKLDGSVCSAPVLQLVAANAANPAAGQSCCWHNQITERFEWQSVYHLSAVLIHGNCVFNSEVRGTEM